MVLKKIVEIAGLKFGEGLPKICVPLTSDGEPALREEVRRATALPADLLEWRADCFFGAPLAALPLVCRELRGLPLLCTVRTQGQGGQSPLDPQEYEELLSALLGQGGMALLDVELSCGRERVERLASLARSRGVGVVVSRHDFHGTPSREEMGKALLEMKSLGADLPKLAVMPQSPEDVLSLLGATLDASRQIGPVITMAMGALGRLSRVSGGLTGSCLTFGAGVRASAPGQLNAEDLSAILRDLDPWEDGGKKEV